MYAIKDTTDFFKKSCRHLRITFSSNLNMKPKNEINFPLRRESFKIKKQKLNLENMKIEDNFKGFVTSLPSSCSLSNSINSHRLIYICIYI